MLEKSEKTADMIDLVKYLLYKATGDDFGVTEFDFNVFKFNKINVVGGAGILSVTSSPITKEQFVECVQSYSAALSKGTRTAAFRENAEIIFDTCVNNNINPVLCAAQAWQEQNWVYPNTSPYNYWGIAVYNGQNYGKAFSSVENGVQGYCNQLNSQMSGSLYSLYQARAAEFATVNDKFKGDMSNMYDVFSAYAYIGDGHTLAEEAEYVVNYVDLLGKCAVQIFGEDVLGAGSGVTTQEEADALTEKFNQMLNTVVHQQAGKGRVGPYQLGPYEKWWSYPYSGLTPFQCTWWANGRACMYLEQYGTKYTKYPTQIGNGGDYYNENLKGGWFNYGSTPKVNSIISWRGGEYGHVAYVEGVTDDGIWISDAGSGVAWRGVRKITLSYAASSNGYIYLDEPL
jgi:surface antigen